MCLKAKKAGELAGIRKECYYFDMLQVIVTGGGRVETAGIASTDANWGKSGSVFLLDYMPSCLLILSTPLHTE